MWPKTMLAIIGETRPLEGLKIWRGIEGLSMEQVLLLVTKSAIVFWFSFNSIFI